MDQITIIYSSLAIICSTALLVCAWKVLDWVWLKPKKLEKRLKEQGFRGSPYKLLYGDFKERVRLHNEAKSKPIPFTHDIVPTVTPHLNLIIQKYGKKSYFWMGIKPAVLIMDPELIKEVTIKYATFQKPHMNPLFRLLISGLVSYEGDKWAKHRKIINPAFHQEKLKLMLPAFYTSASEIVSKWDEIVSQKGSCEVDVFPYLQTLTSDAISRTAFGSNYEEGRRIFELQREQTTNVFTAVQTIYIPGWRFLPTKMNRRMKNISNEVNELIGTMIDSRMEAMRAGEACGNDLLYMLLESNFTEIDNHGKKEFGLTRQDVIEECKLFYFAGQETTSTLLTWTMVLLSGHQNWQTRAREEVLQIFGTNRPDFDGLHHLKILNMILHEVLRLYPAVQTITRKTTEETKLGDLALPEGVLISLPALLLHHDPQLWGADANEFNPERFSEGVLNATKGQLIFFPFGWGPRICVGQNFAMLEAKMAMAMILQRFSFQLSPSYTHSPTGALLQPQHGAHLILHKLS